MRSTAAQATLLTLALGVLAACGAEETGANLDLLRNPADSAFHATAPDTFQVRFSTTKGDVVIEVQRAWSPHGADRFYNLVRNGFYDDVAFFRVVENFMVQFGINGDPRTAVAWATETIPDDPRVLSNRPGTVSFAMRGPNSRTTQLFINFVDNMPLDDQGFTPIGQVVEGMDVVNQIYSGYGEMAPRGGGPAPQFIMQRGNAWLRSDYPRLDYIRTAVIE
jgi:peptidyl-prolyl cis-trans isomerase A (cyclophilin A)